MEGLCGNYLDVSEEGWFEMSEISTQIMKDIYEDRVELFVLYDKLKKTEGKWQTYGSKGILGGPNNEHLILSENADHEVLDQKTILSLIKETFSRFSQSFYRIYCFVFHVPNGNDMINSFKGLESDPDVYVMIPPPLYQKGAY